MHPRNVPNPNIDWDSINYTDASDNCRPDKGYRTCNKCGNTYAINSWNFGHNKQSADGYSYTCKTCAKKYAKKYRSNHRS